jgi:hypothetical protein
MNDSDTYIGVVAGKSVSPREAVAHSLAQLQHECGLLRLALRCCFFRTAMPLDVWSLILQYADDVTLVHLEMSGIRSDLHNVLVKEKTPGDHLPAWLLFRNSLSFTHMGRRGCFQAKR